MTRPIPPAAGYDLGDVPALVERLDLGPAPAAKKSIADHRLTFGRLALYIEPRDAWVGAYVAADAVYVCPLPFLVARWAR